MQFFKFNILSKCVRYEFYYNRLEKLMQINYILRLCFFNIKNYMIKLLMRVANTYKSE